MSKLKQLYQDIEAPSPPWAKKLRSTLTSVYSLAIVSNESGLIDLIPESEDSNLSTWIKFGSAAFIILANIYLSSFIDKDKVNENKEKVEEDLVIEQEENQYYEEDDTI